MKRSSVRLVARDLKRRAVSCPSSNSTLHPAACTPDTVVSIQRKRQLSRFAQKRLPSQAGTFQASAVVSPLPEDDASTATATSTSTPGYTGNPSVSRSLFQRDDFFLDLEVAPVELRPSATLTTGQCFHWKVVVQTSAQTLPTDTERTTKQKQSSAWGTHNAANWIGTLRLSTTGETVVVLIQETPYTVLYRTLHAPCSLDVRSFLYSYFQLPDNNESNFSPERVASSWTAMNRPSLRDLYQEWSTQCDRLCRIADCIPGVRIMDQDPWECLVSFLCSSNNNIPRITKILSAIRKRYGEPILNVTPKCLGDKRILDSGLESEDDTENIQLYSFPSLLQLVSQATENDLRLHCGMGYRAKYLMETMKKLTELGGESYLHDLREISNPIEVQEKLLQFTGVGRKVADCVALFSLKSSNAVPVDVHVWNIARRDYGADALIRTKSLTPTIYRQIGDLFRSRFPTRSGWAHSLLFVAELPSFRGALPTDLVEEMDQFRAQEKMKKEAGKNKLKADNKDQFD